MSFLGQFCDFAFYLCITLQPHYETLSFFVRLRGEFPGAIQWIVNQAQASSSIWVQSLVSKAGLLEISFQRGILGLYDDGAQRTTFSRIKLPYMIKGLSEFLPAWSTVMYCNRALLTASWRYTSAMLSIFIHQTLTDSVPVLHSSMHRVTTMMTRCARKPVFAVRNPQRLGCLKLLT